MKTPTLSLLSLLLALLPSTHAANSIKLVNHCPYPIWYWTVGPTLAGEDYQSTEVPPNSRSVVHAMLNTEALGGGLSLKIRDLPHYRVAPAGIVQLEYHLEPSHNLLWYDLSMVDCNLADGPQSSSFCPLVQGGINVVIPGADEKLCPRATCGAAGCKNAYLIDGGWYGEPSWACGAGADILFETCTIGAGPQTLEEQSSPAPAPAPAPAPVTVPTGPLSVSGDGRCGGQWTCEGSGFGSCCSKHGFCGVSPAYCEDGCQMAFGTCSGEALAPPPPAPKTASPNGKCGGATGFTCAGSSFGQCCSQYNYCGNTADHCNAGCQSAFGGCA